MPRNVVRIICMILAALFVISAASLLFSSIAYGAGPRSRDETVYVDMDADGNITGVISSVYLGNPGGADAITEHTGLTGIKNLSGLEAPKEEGGALIFRANGEDVIYQGEGDASALPFDVFVSYILDEKPIKATELAGKSGRVGITVRVANKKKQTLEVDGEQAELYVPFTIICMYTLGEGFSNISTSGKLTNQAGAASVMGFLMPGLAESLDDLENDKISDTLTIEADVKDFELSEATVIGMVGMVDESDLSGIDDIQDMVDGIDEMESATKKLRDGARELRDGSEEFSEGTEELADGSDKLADGVKKAADGSLEVTDGIGSAYKGVDEIYTKLTGGTGGTGGGGSGGSVSESEIAAMKNWLKAMAGSSTPGNVQAAKGVLMYIEGLEAAVKQAQAMQGQMGELVKGIGTLRSGLKELYNGSLELALGLDELSNGTKEFKDGAVELADGAKEFTDGADKLYDGLVKLHKDGMKKMLDETSSISVSLSRKDALLTLSEEYNAFSATKPVVQGSVQFLFTLDEIAPELPIEEATPSSADEQEAEVLASERSFFQKIGEWFKNLFK